MYVCMCVLVWQASGWLVHGHGYLGLRVLIYFTQMDLKQMPVSARGFRYILLVVDVYSRHVWGFCLKDKTCQSVGECLRSLMQTTAPPLILQSDWGTEFNGK